MSLSKLMAPLLRDSQDGWHVSEPEVAASYSFEDVIGFHCPRLVILTLG